MEPTFQSVESVVKSTMPEVGVDQLWHVQWRFGSWWWRSRRTCLLPGLDDKLYIALGRESQVCLFPSTLFLLKSKIVPSNIVVASAYFQVFCRKFERFVVAGDWESPIFPIHFLPPQAKDDVFFEDSLNFGVDTFTSKICHRWFHRRP